MGVRVLVVAGFLVGLAGSLHAQSLADVARKEEERRKNVRTSGKVYGNADLKSVPSDATPPPPATAAAATPSTAAAADQNAAGNSEAKDKPAVKDQAYWSGRIKALREQLDRDRTYIEALQSRVNALTSDVVSRDDPAQRALLEADRQKALMELERLKKSITAQTTAIADLEEEARRAGVPPGWLR